MLNNQMVHLSTQLGFHTNQARFFSGKCDPAQNWDICRKKKVLQTNCGDLAQQN
jgi:hypothetical protein